MDVFSMLQNALIFDAETEEVIGQAIGFEVAHGRMRLKIIRYDVEYEDGDDPTRDDIPEPTIRDNILALGQPRE